MWRVRTATIVFEWRIEMATGTGKVRRQWSVRFGRVAFLQRLAVSVQLTSLILRSLTLRPLFITFVNLKKEIARNSSQSNPTEKYHSHL